MNFNLQLELEKLLRHHDSQNQKIIVYATNQSAEEGESASSGHTIHLAFPQVDNIVDSEDSDSGDSCLGDISENVYSMEITKSMEKLYGFRKETLVPVSVIADKMSECGYLSTTTSCNSHNPTRAVQVESLAGQLPERILLTTLEEFLLKHGGLTQRVIETLLPQLSNQEMADIHQTLMEACEDYENESAGYCVGGSDAPSSKGSYVPSRYMSTNVIAHDATEEDDDPIDTIMDLLDEKMSAGNSLSPDPSKLMDRVLPGAGHPSRSRSTVMSWQSEFQRLQLMREDDTADREAITIAIGNFVSDFVRTATNYARVISTERHLKYRNKSIKPATGMGGLAGGSKYMAMGIFFKFSTDETAGGLYGGSDYWASKAARHDLRMLSLVHGCKPPDVNVPLTCVIECSGVTILAQAQIPVSGNQTLVYGSCDGGRSCRSDHYEARQNMEALGRTLNLRNHKTAGADMALCGDVELHKNEGMYYLLDVARVMPPEPPFSVGGALNRKGPLRRVSMRKQASDSDLVDILTRHLRPEMVQKWKEPLCSDTFTMFDEDVSQRPLHKAAILECVEHMVKVIVPKFAAEIENEPASFDNLTRLSDEMHAAGINVRHLKLVHDNCSQEEWKKCILSEIAARTCKQIVMELFGEISTRFSQRVSVEQPFVQLFLAFVNTLAELDSKESEGLWRMIGNAAQEKFRSGSSQGFSDLYLNIHWGYFIRRLLSMCSVDVRVAGLEGMLESGEAPKDTILHEGHICGLLPRLHTMPIIGISVGVKYFRQARMCSNPNLQLLYLKQSIDALRRHSGSSSESTEYLLRVYLRTAIALTELAVFGSDSNDPLSDSTDSLVEIMKYYSLARNGIESYNHGIDTTIKKSSGNISEVMSLKSRKSNSWIGWCAEELEFHVMLSCAYQHLSAELPRSPSGSSGFHLGNAASIVQKGLLRSDVNRMRHLVATYDPTEAKDSQDVIPKMARVASTAERAQALSQSAILAKYMCMERALLESGGDVRGNEVVSCLYVMLHDMTTRPGDDYLVMALLPEFVRYLVSFGMGTVEGGLRSVCVRIAELMKVSREPNGALESAMSKARLRGPCGRAEVTSTIPLLCAISGDSFLAKRMEEEYAEICEIGMSEGLPLSVPSIQYKILNDRMSEATDLIQRRSTVRCGMTLECYSYHVEIAERIIGLREGACGMHDVMTRLKQSQEEFHQGWWWYLMCLMYRWAGDKYNPSTAKKMLDDTEEWNRNHNVSLFHHDLVVERAIYTMRSLSQKLILESPLTFRSIVPLFELLRTTISAAASAEVAFSFVAASKLHILTGSIIYSLVQFADRVFADAELKSNDVPPDLIAECCVHFLQIFKVCKETMVEGTWVAREEPIKSILEDVVWIQSSTMNRVQELMSLVTRLTVCLSSTAQSSAKTWLIPTATDVDIVKVHKERIIVSTAMTHGPLLRKTAKVFETSLGGDDETLEHLVANNPEGISLAQFFPLAKMFVESLGRLHDTGVIHRDITLSGVKVSDGKITIEMSSKSQSLRTANLPFEPSLKFAAPECLDATLSGLGFESDLYAVGVCLFALLTGRLPFEEENPSTLMYLHRSQPAPLAHEVAASIPPAVGHVVGLLLNKAPSERYRTAYALYCDLGELEELVARGEGEDFIPNKAPVPGVPLPVMKLYGRNHELRRIEELRKLMHDTNETKVAFVEAESGIGKTALINSFEASIDSQDGLFMRGKFEMGQSVPFQAFAIAFLTFMRKLALNPDTANIWEALKKTVGEDMAFLAVGSPALSRGVFDTVIEENSEAAHKELTSGQAIQQSLGAYTRILSELCNHTTIMLYMDDLQWADQASLTLLERLLSLSTLHFLAIVTMRPLADASTQVNATVDELRNSLGKKFITISLGYLDEAVTSELVSDCLSLHSPQKASPLANVLHSITGGHPLFLKQCLMRMHDDNLVYFSFDHGSFSWKSTSHLLTQSDAQGIIKVVGRKILDLNEVHSHMMDILAVLARLGNSTLTPVLGLLTGVELDVVGASLVSASKSGIVSFGGDGTVSFSHDRMQESVLALINSTDDAPDDPRRSKLKPTDLRSLVDRLVWACLRECAVYFEDNMLSMACGEYVGADITVDNEGSQSALPHYYPMGLASLDVDRSFNIDMLDRHAFDLVNMMGSRPDLFSSEDEVLFFSNLARRQARQALGTGAAEVAAPIMRTWAEMVVRLNSSHTDTAVFDSNLSPVEEAELFEKSFVLPDDTWSKYGDIIVDCLTLLMQSEYMTHKAEISHKLFKIIVEKSTSRERLVDIYRLFNKIQMDTNNYVAAGQTLVEALEKVFDFHIDWHPSADTVQSTLEEADSYKDKLIDHDYMKRLQDEGARVNNWDENMIILLLCDMAPCAYTSANLDLYTVINGTMAIRTFKHGFVACTPLGLMYWGFCLTSVHRRYLEGARISEVGWLLVTQPADRGVGAVLHGMCDQYLNSPAHATAIMVTGYPLSLAAANFPYAMYCMMVSTWIQAAGSRPLQTVIDHFKKLLPIMEEINDFMQISMSKALADGAMLLSDPDHVSSDSLRESLDSIGIPWCYYIHAVYMHALPFHILGRDDDALKFVRKYFYDQCGYRPLACAHDLEFVGCVVLLRRKLVIIRMDRSAMEDTTISELDAELAEIDLWVDKWLPIVRNLGEAAPITYGPRWQLVLAAMRRVEGRPWDAIKELEHCRRLAVVGKMVSHAGMSAEMSHEIYDELGIHESAMSSLKAAASLASAWGAHRWAGQLRERIVGYMKEHDTVGALLEVHGNSGD